MRNNTFINRRKFSNRVSILEESGSQGIPRKIMQTRFVKVCDCSAYRRMGMKHDNLRVSSGVICDCTLVSVASCGFRMLLTLEQ